LTRCPRSDARQQRQKGAGGVHHPPKVDIDQPLKVVFGGVSETRAVTDSRVVKECVEMLVSVADDSRPGKQCISLATVHTCDDHARES
jgi:hypothetical protein